MSESTESAHAERVQAVWEAQFGGGDWSIVGYLHDDGVGRLSSGQTSLSEQTPGPQPPGPQPSGCDA